MGVRIDLSYDGDLQCTAVHGPSGDRLTTDAPVDNNGRGLHFSPTDLVATAIGACMMTVMGIAANRKGIDMTGARASVDKEMGSTPRRHIGRLGVRIVLPSSIDAEGRKLLEATARACPVASSLGETTQVDVIFEYEARKALEQ